MWSSIRRPGNFPKIGGNIAPKTSATSAAATAAMHAVLSGADDFQTPYIKNGLNHKVKLGKKGVSSDNIPLYPLLLDGNNIQQSERVNNLNENNGTNIATEIFSKKGTTDRNVSYRNNETTRVIQSSTNSPQNINGKYTEVVGSAESLVGKVLIEQGLGKYCDADFVHCTQLEMQEALDMTQEEMDLAAHELMLQERFHRTQNIQTLKSKTKK